MQEGQKFITGRWKGLVREGWEEVFSDIPRLANSGEVIVDKPDRMVRRIETPQGVIYYKHICGTGTGRSWYFLKSLLRTPRSLAVWRVSEQMRLAGVGCPLPLLAVHSCRLSSFCFEDILVTAEVPFPRVSDLLRNADSDVLRSQILQKAGQGIRELHEKGFVHGDCLPGNICMDDEKKLIFLDNDRTRGKRSFLSRRAQLWNLIQFCSRTTKYLVDMHLLSAFWAGYYWCDPRPVAVLENEQRQMLGKLRQRIAQLEQEQRKS
jgi:tRNA A-37 threonylcarbamoyl transferase component Bud32